jgi:hypothetical protein
MQNVNELRRMIEEKPLTSLGGALLVGFSLGSGLAFPLLAGAGLNRAGLNRMLTSWLRQELEHGLRQIVRTDSEQSPAAAEPEPEDHSASDSGVPGQTPLARKVLDELAGYGNTDA